MLTDFVWIRHTYRFSSVSLITHSSVPMQANEFSYWGKGNAGGSFPCLWQQHLPAEHDVLCKLYTAACRSLEAQGSMKGW